MRSNASRSSAIMPARANTRTPRRFPSGCACAMRAADDVQLSLYVGNRAAGRESSDETQPLVSSTHEHSSDRHFVMPLR
jgi:hypothetical protein